MRVLITDGTSLVGRETAKALLARGHSVRVLVNTNDGGSSDVSGVEPWTATIDDREKLRGAAEDCEACIHIASINTERAAQTFARLNVEGTRNISLEASRANVRRLVYLSALGAEDGDSDFHLSRRKAEAIVRNYTAQWVICRVGTIYGPGDEIFSPLLQAIRTFPVMPVLMRGDVPFQPIWGEDLGNALAAAATRHDLAGRVLDLAGPDETTLHEVLDRMCHLTNRNPVRLPVPGAIAELGARLAQAVGAELPVGRAEFVMAREGVLRPAHLNMLPEIIERAPTPLDLGLRKLLDGQPEQLPHEGVGNLERRRFWADIAGARFTPEQLFSKFCEQFSTVTPDQMDLDAEPGTPRKLRDGATLTMALPIRGHVQVRVVDSTPTQLTLVTLAGHPFAGGVRFLTEKRGDLLRFEAQVYERAANVVDWVSMRTVGHLVQGSTWKSVVEAVAHESGGVATGGVQEETVTLDDEQAHRIESWFEDLVDESRQAANRPGAPAIPRPPVSVAPQESESR
jgi:uncharacterized protein YbjT (DUF2867 family)